MTSNMMWTLNFMEDKYLEIISKLQKCLISLMAPMRAFCHHFNYLKKETTNQSLVVGRQSLPLICLGR